MALSAPFLHHLGCHSPEAQSPLPQIQLINPLATQPAMTGCCLLPSLMCGQRGFWYLWAAEDPQGSKHLLHSKAAALLQDQASYHTQPYRSGFQPGTRAAGVSTAHLQWASAPTLSWRKEGRGQVRDAADRGSDAWSQLELSFMSTTPCFKQTAISIH